MSGIVPGIAENMHKLYMDELSLVSAEFTDTRNTDHAQATLVKVIISFIIGSFNCQGNWLQVTCFCLMSRVSSQLSAIRSVCCGSTENPKMKKQNKKKTSEENVMVGVSVF